MSLLSAPPVSSALPPSRWVQMWSHLLPRCGRVLDLACGSGRHSRFLLAQGLQVTAIDRDAKALASLQAWMGTGDQHDASAPTTPTAPTDIEHTDSTAPTEHNEVSELSDVTGAAVQTEQTPHRPDRLELLQADLEQGPWPLQGREFAGAVVTNYLWRPRFHALLDTLAPGGVLIYETFSAGQETVGRPSQPDFLLQNGELLQLCVGLRVVAFQEVFLDAPERFVQRIVAVKKPLSLECPTTSNYRFRLRT